MRYFTVLKCRDIRRKGTSNHIGKSLEVVRLLIEKLYDEVAKVVEHDTGQQDDIEFELFGQRTILIMQGKVLNVRCQIWHFFFPYISHNNCAALGRHIESGSVKDCF